MDERIGQEISRIEEQHAVRVLFACESGSRAWGFASPDSDWDVRFIYVHPVNWYLSVQHQRDVIEEMLPGDLDVSGWDLRKALGLLRKSNPSLLEWLQSPHVYRADSIFLEEVRRLATEHASSRRLFHHYLSMARSNWRAYLQDEIVVRKKYLYALRPVFACRWIEKNGGLAPMEFDRLLAVAAIRDATLESIQDLLADKKSGTELSSGPRITELSSFIEGELERLGDVSFAEEEAPPVEPFDRLFRKWIGAA